MNKNNWISVKEKLPETKKNYAECYLVTDGRFCWMAYWTTEKEWILADCTNCKNKIDWTDVIAWMPLPDGYTEFGLNEDGSIVKMPKTRRFEAIGNGWTVDMIAWIFSFMKF